MTELRPLWHRAVTAEICWLDGHGQPHAIAVTPLSDGETPCAALPYARAGEVETLRTAERVAFTVTDSRSLRDGQPGMAALGTVRVADDTDGSAFTPDLLPQELRKYPPSRVLADSLLQRRENWWWLPRILVRLGAVTATAELPARTNPARDALMVRERDGELAVDVVEVPDTAPDKVALRGTRELRGDGAPALVLGYDYTMPDLERWEMWSLQGALLGDDLAVTERTGTPDADLTPLRLLTRIRRQRAIAQSCRRNLPPGSGHRVE